MGALLVALPIAIGSAVAGTLLVQGLLRVIRAEQQPAIATLEMVDGQQVHFDAPGRIGVYAWTRRPAAEFARLRFALDPDGARAPLAGARSWLRENDRSLGRARRVKLWTFELAAAGSYRLRVDGLPAPGGGGEIDAQLLLAPAPSDSETRKALVPRIVALVAVSLIGMAALLGSLFAGHSLGSRPAPERPPIAGTDLAGIAAWVRESDVVVRARSVPLAAGGAFAFEPVSVWRGSVEDPPPLRIRTAEAAGEAYAPAAGDDVVLFLGVAEPDGWRTALALLPVDGTGTVPFLGPAGTGSSLSVSALEGFVASQP